MASQDISAAKHADLLFVKLKDDGENDLEAYCIREGIKHILFKNFHDALQLVKQIVQGRENNTGRYRHWGIWS